MVKTVILIPLMYEKKELERILGKVPDDFEETYSEFWDYIEEKLTPFMDRVQAVFHEAPVYGKGVESRIEEIFGKLKGDTEFHYTKNPLLAAEAEAWLELMKNEGNQAIQELLEENAKDQNEHISDVLDKTLKNGSLGVMLFDPERKCSFPESIKVIRMHPFEPTDYLNRHLAKLKLKNKMEKSFP